MAEQVTLGTFNTLQNSSIISTLNANNTLIENAFTDCLSLAGTIPNAMQANLDMNSNQIINLPSPSTINSPVRVSDLASSSAISIVQAGQVTPQMFGAKGDGVTDDTVALQAALNYIGINGGVLSLSSSVYYFTIGLTLNITPLHNTGITGPGTFKPSTTCSGIAALTITGGGGRPTIPFVKGIKLDLTNNTTLSAGILLKGVINCQITDNSFKIDNATSFASNFAVISLQTSVAGDSNFNCFWTLIRGNCIGPVLGPTALVPYGILMKGQANATVIRDNTFTNITVAVAGLPDPVNQDNCNSIHIVSNFFESDVTCIQNIGNPSPASWGDGWNIYDNRVENVTTFFDIDSTGLASVNSSTPPYLHDNYIVNAINYLVNPLSALYSSWEPFFYGGTNPSNVLFANGLAFRILDKGFQVQGAPVSGMVGASIGTPEVVLGNPGGVPTTYFDNGSTAGGIEFTNGNVFKFKSSGHLIGLVGSAPNTQTGGTYTVLDTDDTIIANGSGLVLTLPAASISIGRKLTLRTSVNSTVTSAGSNVSVNSAAPGTAILAATAGKWATIQSDGTNWIVISNN